MLLGIKYEAARIGEVGEDALAGIEEQMKREVGEDWASDDQVLRGRNAVRREHGLPGLGEPGDRPLRPPDTNTPALAQAIREVGFRYNR